MTAWERGRERQEPWRALALLELALPKSEAGGLAALPLAERNAMLLRLRTITFGRRIEGFALCPECGAQLEFTLHAEDLEKQLHAPAEEACLETGMRMRPANSNDLAAAMAADDEAEARAQLLVRTLELPAALEAIPLGQERPEWPQWLERFERLNASAEVRCVLPCAACGGRPVLDLDIAGFLWREVALAARRLLAEIHRLARAYGWSEQAITAMSATRRATYLEMLDA